MFPEQEQSPKTNLRIFKLENKLINRKYALLKIICNCMSLFVCHNFMSLYVCFINVGVDLGFLKQISFGTLCLTS